MPRVLLALSYKVEIMNVCIDSIRFPENKLFPAPFSISFYLTTLIAFRYWFMSWLLRFEPKFWVVEKLGKKKQKQPACRLWQPEMCYWFLQEIQKSWDLNSRSEWIICWEKQQYSKSYFNYSYSTVPWVWMFSWTLSLSLDVQPWAWALNKKLEYDPWVWGLSFSLELQPRA